MKSEKVGKTIDQFIKIIIIASLPILIFIPKTVYPHTNSITHEFVTQAEAPMGSHVHASSISVMAP